MRVRWLRCRPIGSSTVPPPVMTPRAQGEVVRARSRAAASCATSAVCASGVRATTSSPLVSLSRRCTSPGARHDGELGVERQQRILQRVAGVARARVDHEPGRLVDHEQRAVLEHHVERHRLRGHAASSARSRASMRTCSPPRTLSLARSAGRPPRPRRPRSSPEAGPRVLRQRPRQGLVEPQPGRHPRAAPARGYGTPRRRSAVGSACLEFAILPDSYPARSQQKGPHSDVFVGSGARRRGRAVYRPARGLPAAVRTARTS